MTSAGRIRILLVVHGYPPFGVAGVERLSLETAETLSRRGHEVTVLTRRPSAAPPLPSLESEVRGRIPVLTLAGGAVAAGKFPGDATRLERLFERVLIEVDPDVVLVSHLLYHSPGYVAAAQRLGIPVALELHDFFTICPRAHLERVSGELCGGPEGGIACAVHCFVGEEGAEARWVERTRRFAEAVAAADLVLAPSRFVAGRLEALRVRTAPIEVVANSVRPFVPAPRPAPDPEGPLRLGSIGVTTHHKGFHVVLEALRLAALPEARYTIFGQALPDYVGDLRMLAAEVDGLELRLFDRFEPDQLPALLADIDVLVVPSLVPETFSIVAREAFACGVPVIASRIGALPDAVAEGQNGWLFEPGDAVELAALLQCLDGDRRLLRDAAAAIRPEDAVSSEERVDRLEELLRRILRPCAAAG